jgi:uncharacterized damage-inducible protein DinB
MTDRATVVETIRQMIEGEDYHPLDRLINDLTPEQATLRPEGAPYSIATIVWHTWYWVNVWNVVIEGTGDPFGGMDPDASWPEVPADAWADTRERLVTSLRRAAELAATTDLERPTWQGQTAGHNLTQVAVHTAYHIGQIALARQERGLWAP